MLPPQPMLAKKKSKKSFLYGAVLTLALAVILAGCTPAGPGALLKGKKYLERGDIASAVSELKTATTLLATNANAWNYYGVALQRAGQADDAANAYKRALELDRDLVEAHFNLGSLWLEQNKPDQARVEFTAYTLRRNNDAAGWLKLGMAQLKTGEIGQSERSFSAVLSLKTNDPEAFNWLGLAWMQAGKPRDAASFFARDIQLHPDFAPAILNLATVNQQYLHDNKAALENYQAYLALNPRPANWDDVNALASSLEKSGERTAPVAPVERTSPPLAESRPAPRNQSPTPQPPQRYVSHASPPPRASEEDNYTPPPSTPVQTVQVAPEEPIVASPKTNRPVTVASAKIEPPAQTQPVEVPMPPEQKKPGFWHRLFGGSSPSNEANSKYLGSGLTPLPPGGDATVQPTKTSELPPAKPAMQPAPVFARYNYYSPRKPEKGDHSVGSPAAGAFTRARLAETDEKWTEALEWYQQAATLDPSWFEAQYNTGVMAHRLRNYALALPRYEAALAIQPDSVDARYNFALALKAGGYPMDAANELKKILSANPDEVRAHLALANICAQSLRDMDQARLHYQRVLALDPQSQQASDIRFWLSANQK
jgi:tetratricopeptide (TPR) repeat protein